jgi:hypothetical protein
LKNKIVFSYSYGVAFITEGASIDEDVVVAFGAFFGVAGIPHIFDSVELTNLSFGLLGLQNAAFCLGVSSWACVTLKVSIPVIIIVVTRAAIITGIMKSLVIIVDAFLTFIFIFSHNK